MLAHARHGCFCGEKERFLRERVIRTLLCDNFKLRLRVCEILATVIKLRLFHSNFPSKLRLAMLLQKPPSELNDFRFVFAGCFFYPDAKIIGAFGGSTGWCGLKCLVQVFSRFIQAWR